MYEQSRQQHRPKQKTAMDALDGVVVSRAIAALSLGATVAQELSENFDFLDPLFDRIGDPERWTRWSLVALVLAGAANYVASPSCDTLAGVQCAVMMLMYSCMWLWEVPLSDIIPWHVVVCSVAFAMPHGDGLFLWAGALGDYTSVSVYAAAFWLSCVTAAALCVWSAFFNKAPGAFQWQLGPRVTSHAKVRHAAAARVAHHGRTADSRLPMLACYMFCTVL